MDMKKIKSVIVMLLMVCSSLFFVAVADQTFEHKINVSSMPVEKNQVSSLGYSPLDISDWWNASWPYCKQITINHLLVNGDQVNFPVLIKSTSLSFANHAQANGNDFVFMSANNLTKYSHQIDYYNPITGELVAWVNITFLSSTVDTVIWLYYGNPSCGNQSNVSGVWDSNKYIGVWHMQDYNTSAVLDSSTKHNDGTKTSANHPLNETGFLGACQNFTPVHMDAIKVGQPRDSGTQDFTVSFWLYQTGFNTSEWDYLVHAETAGNNRWFIAVASQGMNNSIAFYTQQTSASFVYSSIHIVANTWYYVTVVKNSTTGYIYINGTVNGRASCQSDVGTQNMGIGARVNPPNAGQAGPLAKIDEVEMAKIDLGAKWIATSYNTTFNSSFATIGAERFIGNNPPTFGTPSPTNGSTNQPIAFIWSIPINDADSDPINWSIQCSNGNKNFSNPTTANGTENLTITGLTYGTTYTVWVNATDPTGSGQWTNLTYTFTTKPANPPTNFTVTSNNLIALSWTPGDYSNTHIERKAGGILDFTTFTLVNTSAPLPTTWNVWNTNVSWKTIYRNEHGYLYKDYGTNYFTGNYNFTLETSISDIVGSGLPAQAGIWMVSNQVAPMDSQTGSFYAVSWYQSGGIDYPIWMILRNENTYVTYNFGIPSTFIKKPYYLNIQMIGTTLHCFIYNDAAYTSLIDDLSMTVTPHSYRYLFCGFGENSSVGSDTPISGYVRNVTMLSPNHVWGLNEGTTVYDGSGTTYTDTNTSIAGIRYYEAWGNLSGTYTTGFATTSATYDCSPTFGLPSPVNGSTNLPINPSWNISINDYEGDLFDWTIQCSNTQQSSGNSASNGTKTLSLLGLDYSTTYTIWVNATDPAGNGNYTRAYYTFTTKIDSAPSFGTPSPTNGSSTSNHLPFTWSIPITDPDGDHFNWTIQCNGQSSSATNVANGTASLSLSGLTPKTYTIWVNATDGYLYARAWYTFTVADSPPSFTISTGYNNSGIHNLSLIWSIAMDDYEGDLITWTIQCSNGQYNASTTANGTENLTITGLTYGTTYTVWVNATDGYVYSRAWYTFTVLYDVYVDDDAAPSWYDATHVKTIQEAVDNASSGQVIFVYGGIYPEISVNGSAHITIASKSLTIVGDKNDMPQISPLLSSSVGQYIFYFTGSGYSLTLQYLDVSNQAGGNTTPVHYGIYVPSQNNLTIDHCVLHDINQVLKCYGNITFTNNTAFHFKYRVVEGSWSAATYALHFVCDYNVIYDAIVTGINNEAIKPKYGHWYGEICYNYIAGCRVGIWIDEEGIGPLCKFGGSWTVAHNTIVSRYDPSNPDDIEQAISLTSTSDNFSKIHIRDNLISGCGYYAIHLGMYSTGEPYSDNTTIQNCLFWDYYTYWNDTIMHRARYLNLTNQLYFQWNGTGYSTNVTYGSDDPHTICGWGYNTTADYLFNIKNCIVADPLFVGAGSPEVRWSLLYGSPALSNATDGTNIGAWQGIPSENLFFFADEYPANNTHGNPLSLNWQIVIDPAVVFNWTIECSNGQSSSGTGDIGGTKSLSLSGLSPLTTYIIWVNATDGVSWLRATYTFTTGLVIPVYPMNFTETFNHLILHPESDIKTEWTVVGATSHYNAVLNNSDGKYVYSSSGTAQQESFGLTNHTTETGQIQDVIICSYDRASISPDWPSWGISDGTHYWWSNGTTPITDIYAWYNISCGPKVPWSGQDWTWDDIDNLTANVISSGEKTLYCDQLYLLVEYSSYAILNQTIADGATYAHVYNSYLTATVSNPGGMSMNISFYWADGTLIHTVTGVANGSTANISLALYNTPYPWLPHDTNLYWYIIIDNGTGQQSSPVWRFHTSKAWDCDENKVVNYLDMSIVVSNYGTSGFLPGAIPADINNDGTVNYLDLSAVVSHYGESY